MNFHSFRHWKATNEYHNTKDLSHVQEVLDHKNIEITRGYICIEKAIYKYQRMTNSTLKLQHLNQK